MEGMWITSLVRASFVLSDSLKLYLVQIKAGAVR